MNARKQLAQVVPLTLAGVVLGFFTSLAAGCESDAVSGDCQCHPARVRSTLLGEPSTNDGEFPSLEGAWLDVRSLDASTDYDPDKPAAVLEYLEDEELVRVKFAVHDPDSLSPNGGAGGAL